jgi:hypothetical protein
MYVLRVGTFLPLEYNFHAIVSGFFSLITAMRGADYTAGLYHIEWNNGYNYAIEASAKHASYGAPSWSAFPPSRYTLHLPLFFFKNIKKIYSACNRFLHQYTYSM